MQDSDIQTQHSIPNRKHNCQSITPLLDLSCLRGGCGVPDSASSLFVGMAPAGQHGQQLEMLMFRRLPMPELQLKSSNPVENLHRERRTQLKWCHS